MSCTLVEPPSGDASDESSRTERKSAGPMAPPGGAKDRPGSTYQDTAADDCRRQRETFVRTRGRIERNLHVVNPSVTAVSQLGQQMLGGVEIIDLDSPM